MAEKKVNPMTFRPKELSVDADIQLRTRSALTRATEVFDDLPAASAWLHQEIRSLGGMTPLSLMKTESGLQRVMDTLGRIEQGIVA